LLDERVQVLRRVLARGQTREGGKLVDERLQLLDLADDRSRALLEELAVLLELLGVALVETLRRQLDRRERILDLVGDTTRALPPRLHALHLDDLGDVLAEEEDAERLAGGVAQHRRRENQRQHAAAGEELHLALHATAGSRERHAGPQLRDH